MQLPTLTHCVAFSVTVLSFQAGEAVTRGIVYAISSSLNSNFKKVNLGFSLAVNT